MALREIGLAMTDQPIVVKEESTSPDVECLRRWKRGDVTAFNALMSRYERRLYHLIWKVVRNDQDAQDILQWRIGSVGNSSFIATVMGLTSRSGAR